MNEETIYRRRQMIFDWLPLGVITVGLALDDAWFTYLGFAFYGTLGLIELLISRTPKKQFLKILKISTLSLTLIISLLSIIHNPTYFVVLLALVLLDRILLTRRRLTLG
jgi:hypothetical protein